MPSPATLAYSTPSTSTATMTCPGPSRITTRSLMATVPSAPPQPTSRPGTGTGVHLPAATWSRASGRRSAVTDISTPMLPQATPSTGRELGAAACSAARAVPSPPRASSRSQSGASAGSATRRVWPATTTWPTATPCAEAQAAISSSGRSIRRVGWTTTPSRRMAPLSSPPQAAAPVRRRPGRRTPRRTRRGPGGRARVGAPGHRTPNRSSRATGAATVARCARRG